MLKSLSPMDKFLEIFETLYGKIEMKKRSTHITTKTNSTNERRININTNELTNKSILVMTINTKVFSPNATSCFAIIVSVKTEIDDEKNYSYLLCLQNQNDALLQVRGFDKSEKIFGRHVLKIFLDRYQNGFTNVSSKISSLEDEDMMMVEKDDLSNFLECLISFIEKTNSSYQGICPICYREKDHDTLDISPCSSCEPKSYGNCYNDYIVDYYDKNKNIFFLILYTSLAALDTKERFLPVPTYCKDGKYDDKLLGVKHVNRNIGYYGKSLAISKTDKELCKRIKKTEYMFLKHMLLSNATRLNYYDKIVTSDNDSSSVDDVNLWSKTIKTIKTIKTMTNSKNIKHNKNYEIPKIAEQKLSINIGTNDYIVFTVDHSIEKQKLFNDSTNMVHMFHGSSVSNWYSIMRNGLKNLSGTKLMTNGQAYGPGIYLSPFIATASEYCKKEYDKTIIGVVQVLNSEKYMKNSSVYVVPQESDVLLKYLVVISTMNRTDMNNIEKFLTNELPNSISKNVVLSARITQKRLAFEMKSFLKNTKKFIEQNHITMKITDSTSSVDTLWAIEIEFEDSIKNVDIHVTYPKSFPSTPCIIELNKYIKMPLISKTQTNDNGNLYVYNDPSLRHERWNTGVKVHKILEQLIINLVEYL